MGDNMNTVGIFNETKEKIEEIEELQAFIEYAIQEEALENVEFNIIFVDNVKIHELNFTYRHIDRPTDVITFALEDHKDVVIPEHRLLGDIYISIDKAKEQAKEYGHSLKREIFFLSLHGFLHLLGYDHIKKEEEIKMFQRQELILNGYGITR